MWVEILGIFATLMILVSMSCKTMTFKSSVVMRITNIIGSVAFTVYGFILPAWSTGILNAVLIIVNTYHLVKLVMDNKKQNSETKNIENKQ